MYACRYRELAEVLAAADHTVLPDDLPACEQPAIWVTSVFVKADGMDVETYTQTCDHHDEQLHSQRGYQLSRKLRRR